MLERAGIGHRSPKDLADRTQRPEALATDCAPAEPVVKHAVETLAKRIDAMMAAVAAIMASILSRNSRGRSI